MAILELDFQLVVDAVIAHTRTCLADASTEKAKVATGLLTIQEDLRRRAAPPPVLAQLEVYVRSLREPPE